MIFIALAGSALTAHEGVAATGTELAPAQSTLTALLLALLLAASAAGAGAGASAGVVPAARSFSNG